MVYNSYADASGAGNDVYEFVCRDDLLSARHFILFMFSCQMDYVVNFLCRLKLLADLRKLSGLKEYPHQTS